MVQLNYLTGGVERTFTTRTAAADNRTDNGDASTTRVQDVGGQLVPDAFSSICGSTDGTLLYLALRRSEVVRVVAMDTGKVLRTVATGCTKVVACPNASEHLFFAYGGSTRSSAGDARPLALFNAESGACMRVFATHGEPLAPASTLPTPTTNQRVIQSFAEAKRVQPGAAVPEDDAIALVCVASPGMSCRFCFRAFVIVCFIVRYESRRVSAAK